MKYLSTIRSSIIVLSVCIFSAVPVLAQDAGLPSAEGEPAPDSIIEEITIPEPVPPFETDTASPLGQDHYYTVTLRGNGEAVVAMKAIFSNLTNEPLVTLTFKSPVEDIGNISVYQVKRERECVRYAPRPIISERIDEFRDTQTGQECLEYREPDYYGYWYGKSQYLNTQYQQNGDQVTVTLAEPVSVGKSGSILLSYRTTAYTDQSPFGAYKYRFETLQVADNINQLQVGITTDNNLYLKNADTQVQYQESNLKMAAMEDGVSAIESSQFDSYYQQIGYGDIVKTASSLQPNESYTVEGAYAKNRIQLYGTEITVASIVVLVLFILLAVAIVVTVKKIRKGSTVSSSKTTHSSTSMLNGLNILIAVVGGFASALAISLFTGIFIAGISRLSRIVGYEYSMVVTVLFLIISIGIYLCLLLIPAVLIGLRRGVVVAVSTVASTIFWLITIFIMVIIVILVFFNSSREMIPMSYDAGAVPMRQAVE